MRKNERIRILKSQIKEMNKDFGYSAEDVHIVSGKLAEAQRAFELGEITDEEMTRYLVWLKTSLDSLEEKLETSHLNGSMFIKGVA